MSLRHLWAFLAVALPVLAALIALLPATDLTYHLRAGEEILNHGPHPGRRYVDVHNFGQPWLDQQWGAQAILTTVYRRGRVDRARALPRGARRADLGRTIFELCRRQGTGVRTAAWLALGAFAVSAPAPGLRPQLFAMALSYSPCSSSSNVLRTLGVCGFVPLAVLWANVHGSFSSRRPCWGWPGSPTSPSGRRAGTSRWPSRS